MTFSTYRYNIKPVLKGIAFVVVILLCWMFATVALESIGARQIADLNSIIYGKSGFYSFWMIGSVMFICCFALICFMIFLNCFAKHNFTPFCFGIFFTFLRMARFAHIFISILVAWGFVKFIDLFSLFANSANFRYDYLRHYFLLDRKFCLESIAGYAPAVGSSYYRGVK